MIRILPVLAALLLAAMSALLCASCSESIGAPALPPLPAGHSSLDAEVGEQLREVHAALLSDRGDAASWAAFGCACEANLLFEPAARGYAGATQLEPRVVRWRYRRAVCLAKQGALEEGIAELRAALAIEPRFAPTHVRLGEFLLDQGQSEDARASFAEAARLAPGDPTAWWGLARAELELDQLDAAISAAQRALEVRPDEPFAHHLLGTALRRAGRLEEARGHLAAGAQGERVTIDPFFDLLAPYRSQRARRYDEVRRLTGADRHAEAIPVLQELLAEEPDSQFALNKLAISLGAVGRPSEALPHLAHALELEPRNLRTNLNLAVTLVALGDNDAALARLERTIELEPDLARAHELKGRILRGQGRYPEALPALRRAVELDARNPQVWIWIGSIHLDRAEWPDAATCFERAMADAPERADAPALLAVAYSRIGREPEAIQLMQRAEELARTGDSLTLQTCRAALAAVGIGGGR